MQSSGMESSSSFAADMIVRPRKRSRMESSPSFAADMTRRPRKRSRMEPSSSLAADMIGEPSSKPLTVFGITIPPSKVAAELFGIPDKNSKFYQRESWCVLERVIDDLVRDVDPGNLNQTVAKLFAENIVRGKGLFCRSIMDHQTRHPQKTYIYAALAFLVNYYFPVVGTLLARRLYLQTVHSFQSSNNPLESFRNCLKLFAHLTNLEVVHPLIAYNIVSGCLETNHSDYVKAAAEFFNELLLPKDMFGYSHPEFQSLREQFCKFASNGDLSQDAVKSVEELLHNWDFIFEDYYIRFPEMDWLSRKRIHVHCWRERALINLNIFQDDFKFDPLFLERELAFEWLKRHVLLEEHWEWHKTISTRGTWKIFRCHSGKRQEMCDKLVKSVKPGSEMQLCLDLLEQGICWGMIRICTEVLSLLCKENKLFQSCLEKCFFRVLLMLPEWSCNEMCQYASNIFAILLNKDTISWDVLAYLQPMPQDRTEAHDKFAKKLFQMLYYSQQTEIANKIIGSDAVEKSLFPADDPELCQWTIKFFNPFIKVVAKDIKAMRFPVVG